MECSIVTTLNIHPLILAALLVAINLVAMAVAYAFGWHAGKRSR